MLHFDHYYEKWMSKQLMEETNARRLERLKKGLSYSSIEFLRRVWLPAVGSFEHLHAEWEVRDFSNGYRYVDFAYMPAGTKGGIEIQDYASHARDLDIRRFKDLCRRHCLLALDNWIFLPIAFPSITDEPQQCQQLILAFIGKFVAAPAESNLSWLEAETIRLARRMHKPFTPTDLAKHLSVSNRHARRVLQSLIEKQLLEVASGKSRMRTFRLTEK
ncbi:transcriptional regulator [Paenibacillus sp. HB172176]|uniref:transcriptional regulator n=1 Tax=Paenibacillus sp. HB172176 TaxID=2493690 RepID=UPI00143876D3|nr:transcriptional regulator [Paenibacillus sp. HB172176]